MVELIHSTAQNLELVAIICTSLTTIGIFAYSFHHYVIAPLQRTANAVSNIVERELQTNGGSSLLDKVNRIESKMDTHLVDAEKDSKLLRTHVTDNDIHLGD